MRLPVTRVILTLGIALALLSLGPANASGGRLHSWTTTTLKTTSVTYYWDSVSSIALDSRGTPHVLFNTVENYWGQLVYGTIVDGAWEFSVVKNGSTESPTIAIGPDDKPQVVFYDDGPETVDYATLQNGVWNVTEVAQREWYPGGGGYISVRTSMALDSDGKVYIALHIPASNSTLEIISNDLGTWERKIVEPFTNASIPAIAVGKDGSLHVVYNLYPGGGLVHTWRTDGIWSNETLGFAKSSNSLEPVVAVDPLGRVHVCYLESDEVHYPYRSTVMHALKDGGKWTHEAVNQSINGGYQSMAVDDKGVAYVAFEDGDNADLVCANNAKGTWTSERVDEVDRVGMLPSIALDAESSPRIVYLNQTGMAFKYAVGAPASGVTAGPGGLSTATVAAIVTITVVAALAVGYVVGRMTRPPRTQIPAPAPPPPPTGPM